MGNGVGRTIKPSTNSKTKKSTGLNKKKINKKKIYPGQRCISAACV